ncbi:hypothetical protein B0H14DRAFT_2559522 [Mycena olivaceomarginata]|nr:hypothetical protein B0H14DRAFT_2559522 [Mycena olivaceomarginata]
MAHTSTNRACTRVHMLTPKLLEWQLDTLRDLWIRYCLTGKKWGKQDVPNHLLAPVPAPQPPIPASRRTFTTLSKRKRSPSPPPRPREVTTGPVERNFIDLTLPERKKRKIVIDLRVIDLTN